MAICLQSNELCQIVIYMYNEEKDQPDISSKNQVRCRKGKTPIISTVFARTAAWGVQHIAHYYTYFAILVSQAGKNNNCTVLFIFVCHELRSSVYS